MKHVRSDRRSFVQPIEINALSIEMNKRSKAWSRKPAASEGK